MKTPPVSRGRVRHEPSELLEVVAVTLVATARLLVLLRLLRDQRLGGEHEARNRRRVLDRRAHDLRRVDHAALDEVLVLELRGVEAERARAVLDLRAHDRAVDAGVTGDLTQRLLERAADDLDAIAA